MFSSPELGPILKKQLQNTTITTIMTRKNPNPNPNQNPNPPTTKPPEPITHEREVGDSRMSFSLQNVYDRPSLRINQNHNFFQKI
jgi:hypothetical protein